MHVENVDGMNGEAHARFYGTKGTKNTGNNNFVDYDNAAKELGGTFSMKSGTAEYVGYFGAEAIMDKELFEKGLERRKATLGAEYVEKNLANADDFTQAVSKK